MMAAHADRRGDGGEIRRFFRLGDEIAGPRDSRALAFGKGSRIGFAALAGAEACTPRVFACVEEANILQMRQARGTGRAAIHSRCQHGEKEGFGSRAVAPLNCFPTLFVPLFAQAWLRAHYSILIRHHFA